MTVKSDIYVSSLAFLGMPAEEMIQTVAAHGWSLEFSSGLPFRPDMEALYVAAPFRKIPHNYFPAPEVPFVLNLASSNPALRERSVRHCLQGLELAKQADAPFFSAHAGFCIDPDPEHLGRKLPQDIPYDRAAHWGLFKDSLQVILAEAESMGLDFLLENNVVAAMNLWDNGSHPLFCADAEEIVQIMKEMDHPRLGLLLDTAHWKVSAGSLGFDKDARLAGIQPWVRGIHHSDNDGLLDTNEPLQEDYWFLQHQSAYSELPQVLEVKRQAPEQINTQIDLLQQQG